MLKGQNGITLVALVITIIVLLILASVTISLTLGQNGLFNTAKNAAKPTFTWHDCQAYRNRMPTGTAKSGIAITPTSRRNIHVPPAREDSNKALPFSETFSPLNLVTK